MYLLEILLFACQLEKAFTELGNTNKVSLCWKTMLKKAFWSILTKADKSHGRAPGQASDYALWAPPLLTVAQWPDVLSRFRGPQDFGPRYFAPSSPPLAGLDINNDGVPCSDPSETKIYAPNLSLLKN